MACANAVARYNGTTKVPLAGSTGYAAAGSLMSGTFSINATCPYDGERWLVVN